MCSYLNKSCIKIAFNNYFLLEHDIYYLNKILICRTIASIAPTLIATALGVGIH